MIFTVFNATQITRTVERPDLNLGALALLVGESYVEGEFLPSTYYVSSGGLVARPNFSIVSVKTAIDADSTDVAEFTGIPVGTTVSVDNLATVVSDGVFHLTADFAGTYPVTFTLYPYKDLIVDVTATD